MYDHYKTVPDPAQRVNHKKKKPKLIAVVDEDNCTGCQVCIPFCPVECIGCQICAKVCTKLTWDAIRMLKTEEFEEVYDYEISDNLRK